MADAELRHQVGAVAGMLVAVVGPSGAGKDTLIAHAAEYFRNRSDVHFVQRVITRPQDAGGEDHLGVSETEFEAMRAAGAFAVDWKAHGLSYGIPASVREKLALGHLVVANGSRSALDRFASAFTPFVTVNIVARPEVLADRLEARGRETREDIDRRLARARFEISGPFDVVTIDNSGNVVEAAQAMNSTLQGFLTRE